MSRPQDQRFQQLLHAYELGMLSEVQEEEFELLLMEQPEYFERVERLREATHLLRYNPAARATISRVLDEQADAAPESDQVEIESAPVRKLWTRLLPVPLAAAAVLVIMLLANWQIEIHPTPEAVALENRLAVMAFENLTGHDDARRLGEISASLLVTDLSESRYVQVISRQRLNDVVRMMGEDETPILDQETAMQAARDAQARWMLTGSIMQVEPYLAISAQLIDVKSGNVTASQRVAGEPGEDIFAVIDKLTVQVKNDLALPQGARREPDRSVAEVTTHSREAYRCYIEGRELYYKYYFTEAARNFESAVAHDSTFAMAYYYLARITDPKMIEKAVRFAAGASHKEQFYIRFLQAGIQGNSDQMLAELEQAIKRYPDEKEFYFYLGSYYSDIAEHDKAIEYYNEAIAIDSLYKTAYNSIAYAYNAMGDMERAIQAINTYISLAPDEANPYDSRGEIYAADGQYDLAIESFRRALELKPDYAFSLSQLAALYMYIQDYRRAESCFVALAGFDFTGAESSSRYLRAIIPLAQGKYTQALRMLSDGISADSSAGDFTSRFRGPGGKHFMKAVIYARQKDTAMAIRELERTFAIDRQNFPEDRVIFRWFHGQLLAETGNLDQARQVAGDLKVVLEGKGQPPWAYWYVTGVIKLAEDKPQEAVNAFEQAASVAEAGLFYIHYMLARAYLASGAYEQAAAQFEEELSTYGAEWRLWLSNWYTEMHYYLGLAYELGGRREEAADQYRTFLTIWKDADPGIAEVEDARARLAGLEESS